MPARTSVESVIEVFSFTLLLYYRCPEANQSRGHPPGRDCHRLSTQPAVITTPLQTYLPSGRSAQGCVKLWMLTTTQRAGMTR
jgi:hypothetical protein